MSDFKKMLHQDVKDVFLNPEEFAEEHTICGKRVLCIIDKNSEADSKLSGIFGTFINDLTIYVQEGSLKVPKIGERISIDRSVHLVKNVSVEDGMIVIVAEANLS